MAESSIITLTDWPNGVILPKGSHLQEPVTALRALSDAVGFDRRRPRAPVRTDWRLGQIVGSGPAGEADYDDERYWLQFIAITGSDPTDTLQIDNDELEPVQVVTATNLNEWHEGTHFMSLNDLVWVRGKADTGQPQQTHWAFDTQPHRPIYVLLSLNSGSNGNVVSTTVNNATYTYDLLSPETSNPIPGATNITPAGIREQGPLVGPATRGIARLSADGSTWTLIWCDERRTLIACP